MSTVNVNLFDGRPLLDIASYARRGLTRRDQLSPAELAQLARTVRRAPEAVVKVLTRYSSNFASVAGHVDYIGRKGELELETDEGTLLGGKDVGRKLLGDWDLDLDEHRKQADLDPALGRKRPKVVHKLVFSMPPGTPAAGLLAAAGNFLREEFSLRHRYAFVLHTDEPHPHVHAIVKAVSEQGVRLNIRKATLREWRAQFARHLREQGIEANATERAVRGQVKGHKLDGIYRASMDRCRHSTHMEAKVHAVGSELTRGRLGVERGKSELIETRSAIESGWRVLAGLLTAQGQPTLAKDIERFVAQMSPPRTEKEQIALALVARARELRAKNGPSAR